MLRPCPLALAAALLIVPLAADVLVVDPGGGAAYADIQAAVDAAVDGDLVLVRPGTYGPVVIDGKGISISADSGATVVVDGGLTVTSTLLHQEVLLAGLELVGDYLAPGGGPHALEGQVVRGPLRVQDCAMLGAEGFWNTGTMDDGGDGVRFADVLDAALTRCTLVGGGSGAHLSFSQIPDAGHGLRLTDSVATLYGCDVDAGDGEQVTEVQWLDYGGRAGHGALVVDSALYAAGSTLTGGLGGTESICALSHPSGAGVLAEGPSTVVEVFDTLLEGGGINWCGTGPGPPSSLTLGATLLSLTGASRAFSIPSPTRAGAQEDLLVDAEPGDLAWLLISFTHGRRELTAAFSSPLLVGTPLAVPRRWLGFVPASGSLSTPFAAPVPPPGELHREFVLQLFSVSSNGTPQLGNPQSWLVLDAGL